MSVLIEGMEMPKGLAERGFVIRGDGRVRTFNGAVIDYATAVPVSTHGRLGDLDELYTRLERWYQTYERAFSESEVTYVRAMLAGVKETPTIIPAEEGE